MPYKRPRRLPFTRTPFPDELPSSWLGRLAAIYGTTWEALRQANDWPHVGDYSIRRCDAEFLSELTSVDAEQITQLTLNERFGGEPITRFLCHPVAGQAVPDFCAECFRDDLRAGRDSYIRHQWTIAGVGHCHIHKRTLHSFCPSCFADITPRMQIASNIVRVCCPRCATDMASLQSVQNTAGSSPTWPYAQSCEARVLVSLGNDWDAKRFRFKPIEDIAFLLFYGELPQSAVLCKPRLRRWGGDNISGLAQPLRKAGKIFDRSLLFPLATVGAARRSSLLAAAMAIIGEKEAPQGLARSVPTSLDELFYSLDEDRREEMICRADAWPRSLRELVRSIIHRPTRGIRYNPSGWAGSRERRMLNDDEIPRYKYL